MQKVLLVEDSEDIQKLVQALLQNNCQVVLAGRLDQAKSQLRVERFDLVLLDVMLPDGEGFDLLSYLTEQGLHQNTQVVFLTSRDGVPDKVKGFSMGADDYIVKPFNAEEFRARVVARLKRIQELNYNKEVVESGPVHLQVPFQKAFLTEDGQKKDLHLTPIEFKLLLCMVQESGRIFNRNDLIKIVWGDNIHVLNRSIDTHVSSLRKKLGKENTYIQSVYGKGYFFSLRPLERQSA